MRLYGDSGMGKTMILEKMERQHPSTLDERRQIKMRPVLTVQMPPSPDERRFYTRILEILGAPYSIREQLGALEGRVIHLLQKLGTKRTGESWANRYNYPEKVPALLTRKSRGPRVFTDEQERDARCSMSMKIQGIEINGSTSRTDRCG